MNEDVFAATFHRDESKTLLIVEPLYCTLRHDFSKSFRNQLVLFFCRQAPALLTTPTLISDFCGSNKGKGYIDNKISFGFRLNGPGPQDEMRPGDLAAAPFLSIFPLLHLFHPPRRNFSRLQKPIVLAIMLSHTLIVRARASQVGKFAIPSRSASAKM